LLQQQLDPPAPATRDAQPQADTRTPADATTTTNGQADRNAADGASSTEHTEQASTDHTEQASTDHVEQASTDHVEQASTDHTEQASTTGATKSTSDTSTSDVQESTSDEPKSTSDTLASTSGSPADVAAQHREQVQQALASRYQGQVEYESQVASELQAREQAFADAARQWQEGGQQISPAVTEEVRTTYLNQVGKAFSDTLGPLARGQLTGDALSTAWEAYRTRSGELLAAVPDQLASTSTRLAAVAGMQGRFDAAVHEYETGHEPLGAESVSRVNAEFTRLVELAHEELAKPSPPDFVQQYWDRMPDRIEAMLSTESRLNGELKTATDLLDQRLAKEPAPEDQVGMLAQAHTQVRQEFVTNYRAEFNRKVGHWLALPGTQQTWLNQQLNAWTGIRGELIREAAAKIDLLSAGWREVGKQFDRAAPAWQAGQPEDLRLSEQSLQNARLELQAMVVGFHRQVWQQDPHAFAYGQPGSAAASTWRDGLRSIGNGIPGGLEIRRRLEGTMRETDTALDTAVQE